MVELELAVRRVMVGRVFVLELGREVEIGVGSPVLGLVEEVLGLVVVARSTHNSAVRSQSGF